MLRNMKKLLGYSIHATDGNIGRVDDFFVDDQTWSVRYLIVDTGHWLPERKVLILPGSLGHPSWTDKIFPVSLTMERVKNSPDIDTRKPVSRQHEEELHKYYDLCPYWYSSAYPGLTGFPSPLYTGIPQPIVFPATLTSEDTAGNKPKEDPALRSCNEVVGYHIMAGHGSIGHVDDFILDDEEWTIRYLVVNTGTWLLGKKVLMAPLWVNTISWEDKNVYVDLDREIIKNSPDYNPSEPISREYEERLSDYYCKPKYWAK